MIGTPRRYYLLKRHAARTRGERALEGVWRSKQEAEGGTGLPATFPSLTALSLAGYTHVEDVDGATAAELADNAGLSTREAEAVLSALASL